MSNTALIKDRPIFEPLMINEKILQENHIRFDKMLQPKGLSYANQYLAEELNTIESFLSQHKEQLAAFNFVAIGDAKLMYYERVIKYTRQYVVIDPMINLGTTDHLGKLHQKKKNIVQFAAPFSEKFNKSCLPLGNSIFFFFFNVFSYIDNPLESINAIITPGDIIIVSGWNMSKSSMLVFYEYFNFVEGKKCHFTSQELDNLSKQKTFPFHLISNFEKMDHFQNEITETYIIKTVKR